MDRDHSDRSSHDEYSIVAGGTAGRPPLRKESILMIDYAPVQARGNGEAPTASRKEGQAAAKALDATPQLTADGVHTL
jgi:hypothetical protein